MGLSSREERPIAYYPGDLGDDPRLSEFAKAQSGFQAVPPCTPTPLDHHRGRSRGRARRSPASINWQTTPQYESKTRVFIGIDLQGLRGHDRQRFFLVIGRVQSYADLADSTDLMNQVIGDLDLQIDA